MAETAALVAKASPPRPICSSSTSSAARELAGAGLRSEMAEVAAAGLPLLTTVRRDHVDTWLDFKVAKGAAAARRAAILAWWASRGATSGSDSKVYRSTQARIAMAYDPRTSSRKSCAAAALHQALRRCRYLRDEWTSCRSRTATCWC